MTSLIYCFKKNLSYYEAKKLGIKIRKQSYYQLRRAYRNKKYTIGRTERETKEYKEILRVKRIAKTRKKRIEEGKIKFKKRKKRKKRRYIGGLGYPKKYYNYGSITFTVKVSNIEFQWHRMKKYPHYYTKEQIEDDLRFMYEWIRVDYVQKGICQEVVSLDRIEVW